MALCRSSSRRSIISMLRLLRLLVVCFVVVIAVISSSAPLPISVAAEAGIKLMASTLLVAGAVYAAVTLLALWLLYTRLRRPGKQPAAPRPQKKPAKAVKQPQASAPE